MKIDELILQTWNSQARFPVHLPDGEPLCYMLNCKGIGMLADGTGRPKSVVAQVDRELVNQGVAMAYFSLRDYTEARQSPRISEAVSMVIDAANSMREKYGAKPYVTGHSFGGLIAVKAAMEEEVCFAGVVPMNTPIRLDEPLSRITKNWPKMKEPMKSITANALCRVMAVDHHGSPVQVVESVLDESIEHHASRIGCLAQLPVLLLYGKRDAYQFREAGGIAKQQTCAEYEMRWKAIAPHATIVGYEGLGHHFATGLRQQAAVLLGYRPPQVAEIARNILTFVKA